jgi:hypothetical protein
LARRFGRIQGKRGESTKSRMRPETLNEIRVCLRSGIMGKAPLFF